MEGTSQELLDNPDVKSVYFGLLVNERQMKKGLGRMVRSLKGQSNCSLLRQDDSSQNEQEREEAHSQDESRRHHSDC